MKDAVSPEPDRLNWLDALRGWPVLGVVMVHSGPAADNTATKRLKKGNRSGFDS